MATYNSTSSADVLSSSVAAVAAAAAVAEQFERNAATTFLMPSTSAAPLHLESFMPTATSHFVTSAPAVTGTHNVTHHQHTNSSTSSSSSSYTFVQIKREPCQVSEVTTSNNCQQQLASSTASCSSSTTSQQQHQHQHHHQQQHHHHHHQQQQQHHHHQHHHGIVGSASSTISAAATSSKTMASATLTTLVKIEASSPKIHDYDKTPIATLNSASAVGSTNNSVPIGIAVARKRPQESSAMLGNATTIPVQQPLSKDMNCFGIRVADIGGVGTGCGNIYFTGNTGDLMTGSASADELALSAAGIQNVNRAPSTFWQYQSALPIESLISMSPTTVGLAQYSREASRGQVVLLPATATALGISNFPLYTPTDPFQQAAFVWPSYIPQSTPPTTATLQPPPNFLFPSMSPHSTLQPQPYTTSLQLLGSNYLAAAAAAAATTSLCQHNQQTNNSTAGSINLSLGAAGLSNNNLTNNVNSSSCTSSSSRFLSVTSGIGVGGVGGIGGVGELQKPPKHLSVNSLPMPLAPTPLIMPPAAMKIEEWNSATEYMAAAAKTTTTTQLIAPASINFDGRDKTSTTTTTTTNLLELQNNGQALNLIRLPTPPTSATIDPTGTSLSSQILFQAASAPTPALLNLSAGLPRSVGNVALGQPPTLTTNFLNSSTTTTTTLSATIGPPTPVGDDVALNFKTGGGLLNLHQNQQSSDIVAGIPRSNIPNGVQLQGMQPQMQDVNIQTDTPVCSEDENSSCPLAISHSQTIIDNRSTVPVINNCGSSSPVINHAQMYTHGSQAASLQPLELTKANMNEGQLTEIATSTNPECHNIKLNGTAENPEQHVNNNAHNGEQTTPEDLTGLELLSNISTSTLAKGTAIRIKQEPLDQPDECHQIEVCRQNIDNETVSQNHCDDNNRVPIESRLPKDGENVESAQPFNETQQSRPVVESLGGLNLLCALAEQRIQEEYNDENESAPDEQKIETRSDQVPSTSFNEFEPPPEKPAIYCSPAPPPQPTFPNLGNTELPSTSNGAITSEVYVKRKKHKHSKSSKSSTTSSGSKKSLKCGKKNKKKYSKEKKKHKLLSSEEINLNDEQLKEELQSAFTSIDPNCKRLGKWPNAQDIFKIMESNMRMRLADISRQYRKKKRKLDDLSKLKKKKKCLKQSVLQNQPSIATPILTATVTSSLVTTSLVGGLGNCSTSSLLSSLASNSSSLPLCDYKFPNFTKSGITPTGPSCSSSPYLNPSSFLRFAEKTSTTLVQFPPPDVDLSADNKRDSPSMSSTSAVTTATYKPVRLEPSTLSVGDKRNSSSTGSVMRLSSKRPLNEQSNQVIVAKDRKLINSTSRRCSENDENVLSPHQQKPAKERKPSPRDRELMLTNEHLYRKETRVLTDMGGLFYAGIMKPLQPPDVYAITLDGERGNKSHIMSREEIFKDTILEVSPKSVDCVPVGTRLCAYWSQQYRCLYPGRAIESESSDDGITKQNDFVSVEFDDGDSGRIRLQHIRFLLSDYPIAEYNDNPLYSLGKQKKSSTKSGQPLNNSRNHQHEFMQTELSIDGQQRMSTVTNMNSSTSEPHQSAKELFVQRNEKKRLKSLKKKSQAAAAAAAAAAANGTNGLVGSSIGGNNGGIGGDLTGDCNGRKHHKHKKRKKHKKHHHRKGGNEEDSPTGSVYRISSSVTPSNGKLSGGFINKCEVQMDVDQASSQEDDEHHQERLLTIKRSDCNIGNGSANLIKLEVTTANERAINAGMEVKTENLDIEEETASTNLMSEISDEVKGDDEIEHNNSKGSKIAAFLPDRQLWGWQGKAYRKAGLKGRARKQFYKTIKRGKETITVGDCAVFLSTGRPDRPYIGRIESMWETTSSNKVVRVRWFYHPEETSGCPNLKYPGALFESPHEDENDVQTISHRCEVLPFERYFAKFGADAKQYQFIYDNNDTYYLAGYYNPRLQLIKMQEEIPTIDEVME